MSFRFSPSAPRRRLPLPAGFALRYSSATVHHTQPRKHLLTKLRGALAVNGRTRPVIGPRNVAVFSQRNHGLNRKRHADLALAGCLVLGVVWHVGRAVKQLADAVAAVRADDAAVLCLGVLLDDVAKLANLDAGLDGLDGLVQALAGGLDDAHVVRVGLGAVANVVGLVEIGVVALVVEGHVNVEDVAVEEDALVGNAVADDFVDRRTAGLGEVVVVEGRRIRLKHGP